MRQSAAAAEEGQAAEASFLHSVTVRNLQELAASAVLHCLAKPVPFKRSRLSELKVEMWFSLLQRQFANSQMTARSYVQASARQQRRHLQDIRREDHKSRQGADIVLQPLSDETFLQLSTQALRCSLELFALCCGDGSTAESLKQEYGQHCCKAWSKLQFCFSGLYRRGTRGGRRRATSSNHTETPDLEPKARVSSSRVKQLSCRRKQTPDLEPKTRVSSSV